MALQKAEPMGETQEDALQELVYVSMEAKRLCDMLCAGAEPGFLIVQLG